MSLHRLREQPLVPLLMTLLLFLVRLVARSAEVIDAVIVEGQPVAQVTQPPLRLRWPAAAVVVALEASKY